MPNMLEATALVEFQPVNRPVINIGSLRLSYEADNKRYVSGVQEVGDVEEALEVGDISDVGLIALINRSTSENIEVGLTGSYTILLKPGQFCLFPPNSGAIFVHAAGATTADLEYHIFPEEVSEA